MVAEQKVSLSEKKTSSKEKKIGFVKQVRQAWKKVKFLSLSDALKRLGIVTVVVICLSLIVTGLDFVIIKGLSGLSSLTFEANIIKVILAVVFVLLALALIIVEVARHSKTKGFSVTNSSVNNRYRTGDDILSSIVRYLGIALFVVTVLMYVIK